MKFELLPSREKLQSEMNHGRYWHYANHFENLCRFIDDFNIKAFCTSSLNFMTGETFCRILQSGNVKNYSRDYSGALDHAFCRTDNVYLRDHNTWWKTADNKILFSAVPYASKEMCVNAFNKISAEFNFPECIKLKFLDVKYHWRYFDGSSNPHLIIYSEN